MGKFNLAEHIMSEVPASPRNIESITAELLEAKRVGGEAILTIGRCLIEAKQLLPHGSWQTWLAERVEYSERTAQRFMRLAQEYTNPTALSDLGATKALTLLALPADEREQFLAESHLVDGEELPVIDMSARQLEQAVRERNEARAAAEKSAAAQKAAEEARDEIAREMQTVTENLENARRDLEQRQRELDDLRSRPIDVAVEQVVDPVAIEAARKEAMAEMQAKVDKAKAAKDKAEEQRKAAEAALAAANAKLAEAAKAEKKEIIAADKDLVVFQTIFNETQEQVNKLYGYLLRYKSKGDAETAGKLSVALNALANKIREVAKV